MCKSNSWKRNIVCLGWNGQSSVCNFKLSGLRSEASLSEMVPHEQKSERV